MERVLGRSTKIHPHRRNSFVGTRAIWDQGPHTIILTHLTGTYVSLDGFIVSGPPTATPTRTNTYTPTMTRTPTASLTPRPPVGNGTYDERAVNVVYTGSWVAQAVTATI